MHTNTHADRLTESVTGAFAETSPMTQTFMFRPIGREAREHGDRPKKDTDTDTDRQAE